MDVWRKMPEKLRTQVYSLAFNSVKDDRIIKGLAQALAPDKIKTDADRQNMTASEAKQIIKNSFSGSTPKKETQNTTGKRGTFNAATGEIEYN